VSSSDSQFPQSFSPDSPHEESSGEERFDLSAGGPSLALEAEGFRLRVRSGRKRTPLARYQEITHLGVSRRGFWLGTRRSVIYLRRHRFRGREGPERLARALVRRISQRPGGLAQLSRMAEVDHLARRPARRAASVGVALLCVLLFALQRADSFVQEVGAFVPALVGQGEVWRAFTANFLHAPMFVPVHLMMNLAGLLALSFLVERPLGWPRTALVLGASGLGAMAASAAAGYQEVIGASGMVAGLAGSALCLELSFPARLPSWWRIPRRFFIAVLLLQAIIDQWVPSIAAAAHLGGFAAGYLVTLRLAGPALARQASDPWVGRAVAGLALATALAFAVATPLVLRDGGALERYARDLLEVTGLAPTRYNDLAWRMATESRATPEQLKAAVALAERAVGDTERMDPHLLDTLAEVLFARGEGKRAIEVIDEAIALAPMDDYFREQRRRFTGERDPDDRPDPSRFPWLYRRPPDWHPPISREPDVVI
jgi:membrane associated rhomboid family serine protease